MHGNGERDPLDGWLSQQVQPLPPPPGTFELITRRARRRKIRKLTVTIVSAAAVAAGVAIAVPNVLALRLTPAQVAGSQEGRQSATASTGGTPSTNGSGSPVASPTTKTPSPASGPAKPAGPVPPNFQPSSVTFDSPQVGWVIGQAGTPGKCADANPYICTSIARTDDGGQTWHGGPAPKTGAPAGPAGVSGIRFLDGTNGWAFGPELWSTHDKGNTWQPVDTGGQRVTDLETVNGRGYALWASCSGTSAASFAADCTTYTLMTTVAGGDDWRPVGGPTSGLTDNGYPTSGFIALTGSVGYLVAPDGTLYSGPIGGAWSKQGTVRCQPGTPQASGIPANALLAVADPTHLAMACAGTQAGSPPAIYTSDNGGAFWTAASAAGLQGIGTITSLSAAPNGTLVLATSHGLYVKPYNGQQWEQAAGLAPLGGFSYAGMTTDTQGVAVPADTGLHQIWMTYDGGHTWQSRTIS